LNKLTIAILTNIDCPTLNLLSYGMGNDILGNNLTLVIRKTLFLKTL